MNLFLWTEGHATFNKATPPFAPHFFELFTELPNNLGVQNRPFTTLASISTLLILIQAQEREQESHDSSVHVHVVLQPWRTFSYQVSTFERFLPSVCAGALRVEEDDCARCPEWDPWLKLWNTVRSPSINSRIPLFFQRWHFSVRLLNNNVFSILSFRALKLRVLMDWTMCCFFIISIFRSWSSRDLDVIPR